MTLDEAIKHCEEKAKELSDKAYAEWGKSMTEEEAYDCNECAREHEQLAEWLKELKALKEAPKGDLVSRKWLTDAIRNRRTYLSYEDAKDVIDLIDNAPTVKPCENCDLYFKAMTKEERKGGVEYETDN